MEWEQLVLIVASAIVIVIIMYLILTGLGTVETPKLV